MPTQTQGDLGLIKPNNGEFVDQWDTPLNSNADAIDTLTSYVYRSIINAVNASFSDTTALDLVNNVIGSADALKQLVDTFLTSSTLPDDLKFVLNDRFVGTQQAVFEVIARLERYLYSLSQGNEDTDSNHPDQLRNELARRHHYESNCVLTPNMTIGIAAAKPVVQPTGVAPIDIDIQGKTYHLHRAAESASGALGASRGVAFVYAEPQEETIYSDGGNVDGLFTQEAVTNIWRKFTSISVLDFTNARPGHVLRISPKTIGNYDIGGDYIIESINVGEITIVGGVPAREDTVSITGLAFEVIDLFGVKIDHIFVAHATVSYRDMTPKFADTSDKAFLGEIHWSGTTQDNITVYREKAYYDSGWLSIAALATKQPNDPAVTGVISHNIGPVFTPAKTTNVWSNLPLIKVFVGVKDANNYLTDIQEVPFNSFFGGVGTEAQQRGWSGYCNRENVQMAIGIKMPGGAVADYAVQRVLNEASFMTNDPTAEASYITDPSDSYYRIIVSRR